MTTTVNDSTSRRVERPASVAEAAELLRETSGPLLFRGAGTKQAWGGRPAEPALVVETARLSRLLAYNPADMTVAVEAGMPLHDLQEVLREKVSGWPSTRRRGPQVRPSEACSPPATRDRDVCGTAPCATSSSASLWSWRTVPSPTAAAM